MVAIDGVIGCQAVAGYFGGIVWRAINWRPAPGHAAVRGVRAGPWRILASAQGGLALAGLQADLIERGIRGNLEPVSPSSTCRNGAPATASARPSHPATGGLRCTKAAKPLELHCLGAPQPGPHLLRLDSFWQQVAAGIIIIITSVAFYAALPDPGKGGVSGLVHNLDHVFAVADRVMVMRGGRVAATLATASATKQDVLAHIIAATGGAVAA